MKNKKFFVLFLLLAACIPLIYIPLTRRTAASVAMPQTVELWAVGKYEIPSSLSEAGIVKADIVINGIAEIEEGLYIDFDNAGYDDDHFYTITYYPEIGFIRRRRDFPGGPLPLWPREMIFTSEDGIFSAYVSAMHHLSGAWDIASHSLEVTVTNKLTGTELILPLARHVFDLVYISFIQDTIAIEGFLNASNSVLEFFCLETGEKLREHIGLGFVFDCEGRVYYIAIRPNRSPIEAWGHNKIMDEEGNVLFESGAHVIIQGNLAIVGDMLSFYLVDIRRIRELWHEELWVRVFERPFPEEFNEDPITHHTIRIR